MSDEAKISPVFLGAYKAIEDAISEWYRSGAGSYNAKLFEIIGEELRNGMEVLVPLKKVDDGTDEIQFTLQLLTTDDGNWLPVFTGTDELERGEKTSSAPMLFTEMLTLAADSPDFLGVVMNPFGESLCIDTNACETLLELSLPKTQDQLDLEAGSDAYGEGDFAAAVEYYTKSAAAGNVTALSNLGYCHYYGRSIPVDKLKAKECWERAAILGDIPAVYKLGDMYRNGDLEPQLEFSHALHLRAFLMAQYCSDINVYPDAYLRMLRHYPDELENPAQVAEACVKGVRERVELGDRFSDKVLAEAEKYAAQYCVVDEEESNE